MAVLTYTSDGTKSSNSAKLDKSVFSVEVKNHELLRAAYETYLANGRLSLAKTKTRGEVRGSTIKPWRQKGTGRARFGSRYNPIWRGGGIVFGPTGTENYSKHLNLKAKRLAVRQALSLAHNENKIIVIDEFISKAGKTSEFSSLLNKLNLSKNILFVVDKKSPELIRATNNINNLMLVSAKFLNVYDIMNADSILFSKSALQISTEWLNGSANSNSTNVDSPEDKEGATS